MLKGYNGKMLFVNLTDKSIEEKELTEEMASKFIGGYGIGAKVLYDNMPAKADPLGEESMIGFMTGPTSGTKAFFGGRYTVVNKSPVTGGWNDANSGGFFGPELKKAGFDALFVKGISKEPVYIWINEGKVEIKDASKQWGMNSKETLKSLKEELGEDKLRVSCIGPAGENLSNIAAVMNDEHRAAGRGGCGAVMGSKNLKAIAVRGTKEIEVANPDKIVELNKKISAAMKENEMAQGFSVYGTGVFTEGSALNGDSPVKNWGGVGVVDFGEKNAKSVAPAAYDQKYKVKAYNCSNCPLGCGAKYKVDDGKWPVGDTDRPEYETQAAFGSTLLNGDIEAIIKCNEICNIYGIDTISAGMTIAWAMECFEEGVLTKEDLDGIELTWGNGEAIVAIMEKMANNEGIGKVLMKGSMQAAKELGKGEEFLQTASGIELPMHDPKYAPGYARTYQYDPTPGRHVKGGIAMAQMFGMIGKYDYDATGYLDVKMTANQELINSAGFCMFMSLAGAEQGIENQYLEAITGRSFKPQDQDTAGMRILNMRQAFNLREGITPKDLTITKRALGQPPQKEGPVAGVEIDDVKLKNNFFSFIGWDLETGKPSKGALEKLGLDFLIKDLY